MVTFYLHIGAPKIATSNLQTNPPAAAVEAPEVDAERLVSFVGAVREAGSRGTLGPHRSLFARAGLLIIAEHNLWEAALRDERALLEDWALDSRPPAAAVAASPR